MDNLHSETLPDGNVPAIMRVLEGSGISVFLYYPQIKRIIIPAKTASRYGVDVRYDNMPYSFAEQHVRPDCRNDFMAMYASIDNGADSASARFFSEDSIFFFKVTLTTIERDKAGRPTQAVGIIENDVDSPVIPGVKEKLEAWNVANDSSQAVLEAKSLIASAIGRQYYAIYHIWADSRIYMCFREQLNGILSVIGETGEFEPAWEEYINRYVENEDRQAMREFSHFETMVERLRKTDAISTVYRRIGVGWTKGQFVAAKRNDDGSVSNILYMVTDINSEMRKAEALRKVEFDSRHDSLTGVFNRKSFDEETVAESIRSIPLAFILLDIDNFKELNDLHGHDIGDAVLRRVARALTNEFYGNNRVFRIGGDEFGLLLYNVGPGDWDSICDRMGKVHSALADDDGVHVTLSAGICFSDSGYDHSMYKVADEALYSTKRAGKAGLTWLDEESRVKARWKDEVNAPRLKNILSQSNTGLFRIEDPMGPSPRLYCNDTAKRLIGLERILDPHDCFRVWMNGIAAECRDLLLETRKKIYAGGRAECTYVYNHPTMGKLFVRSGGTLERANGEEAVVGYHQLLLETSIVDGYDDSSSLVSAICSVNLYSFYISLAADTYFAFSANESAALVEPKTGGASLFLQKFAEENCIAEFAERLKDFLNLSTLPERIGDENNIDFEFMSLSSAGWCRARFIPVRKNRNEKTENVIFLVEPIDSLRQEEMSESRALHELLSLYHDAADMVLRSKILFIGIIDKATGQGHFRSGSSNFTRNIICDYDMIMKRDAIYSDPVERPAYIKSLLLSTIIEKLKKNGSYEVVANMIDREGKQKVYKYNFRDYGENGESILSVLQDVTRQNSLDAITDTLTKDGFLHYANYFIHSDEDPSRYAVLNFDIINFRAINSQFGYDGGDQILLEVANTLKRSALRPLIVCREMADCFLCFVDQKYLDMDVLNSVCRSTVKIKGLRLNLKLCCGIARVPDNATEIATICDRARVALRLTDNNPGEKICEFNEEVGRRFMEEARVQQEFPDALSNGQLVPYLQPIFDANTGMIISTELLSRWRHPELGLLTPGAFMPALEKNGYVTDLDIRMIEYARSWFEYSRKNGLRIIPAAVNLSRFDLLNPRMREYIHSLFVEDPALAGCLRFEITEEGIESINQESSLFLTSLRKLGVTILVDDFGTGYSSLGSLAEFECDIVKLDISFARRVGKSKRAESIIRSTIEAMKKLGLRVVAEGVETEAQFSFMRDAGCDAIQGYYFSPPVSSEEIKEMFLKPRSRFDDSFNS